MKGINKVAETPSDEYEMYLSGMSICEISEEINIPKSTLRFRFLKAGILRTRTEALQNAGSRGRLSHNKGVKREFTPEWCANISKARSEIATLTAVGVDISKGYARFTRGKFKGEFVHKVVMKLWLGRELVDGECVHHINHDKTDNSIDNLALLTTSGHTRLHRFEDKISAKAIERNSKGEFI